jgi:RNA polymerase sigma-70 factor, ECF subfamily
MGVSSGASLEELETVYESNLSAFVRTAAAICGSREGGRDAVHDAFVSLVRSRANFRGAGSVEAWAWAAVVRTAQKRAARQRELPVADPAENDEPSPLAHDSGLVTEAVAALPERQRLVLFLRYYADLDYEQIAQALGIRRGTVSASLHAAHGALRARLEEEAKNARAL